MATATSFCLHYGPPLVDTTGNFVITMLKRGRITQWVGNESRVTYDNLLLATVIVSLHHRRIEVVQVELTLEGKLVIFIKKVESERGPGSLKGGRVLLHSQ